MRKLILLIILLTLVPVKVYALETEPPEVPDSVRVYMPEETESFAEGLFSILQDGIRLFQPAVAETAGICAGVIAAVLLLSLVGSFPGDSEKIRELIGTVAVSALLLRSSDTLIGLGVETVTELSDYGKLLVPVLTSALAAQGGITSSAALYTGTTIFSAFLMSCIVKLLIPLIRIYLCLAIANSGIGESVLSKLRDLAKWLMTWVLKITLYVFMGYMGVTGVISGSADAAALKATKLTISGVVPVVGGILSDASETVLVSASIVKNSVGVYGLLALCAIWLEPFVKIGVQYLLLKFTAAVCGIFGSKPTVGLIQNFSVAMGMLLAVTGSVCLMLLVSVICFMKGMS